jgi:hypothetical protein
VRARGRSFHALPLAKASSLAMGRGPTTDNVAESGIKVANRGKAARAAIVNRLHTALDEGRWIPDVALQ